MDAPLPENVKAFRNLVAEYEALRNKYNRCEDPARRVALLEEISRILREADDTVSLYLAGLDNPHK